MAESDRDFNALIWRKSSASSMNGGDCVEVASDGKHILVRDSKDRASSLLTISRQAWHIFLNTIKSGDI